MTEELTENPEMDLFIEATQMFGQDFPVHYHDFVVLAETMAIGNHDTIPLIFKLLKMPENTMFFLPTELMKEQEELVLMNCWECNGKGFLNDFNPAGEVTHRWKCDTCGGRGQINKRQYQGSVK